MTEIDMIVSDVERRGLWYRRGLGRVSGADVHTFRLFERALCALDTEDKRLRKALQARPNSALRTSKSSHGLGFWVFEHNLVYEVFKAWLPRADVMWECPIPGEDGEHGYWDMVGDPPRSNRKKPRRSGWFDLAISGDDDAISAVFEFKWWPRLGSARKDLQKLAACGGEYSKFFVGFWISTDLATDLRRGEEEYLRSANDLRTDHPDARAEYVFVGQFETRARWSASTTGGVEPETSTFVMAGVQLHL